MRKSTFIAWSLCILGAALVLARASRMVLESDSHQSTVAREGFAQSQPFLLRRDRECYDDFYAQAYSRVRSDDEWTQYHVDAVVDSTMADPANATVLDVGCGTGTVVDAFARAGFRAVGLDREVAMINECRRAKRRGTFVLGDALDPMAFQQNSFSHICCFYYTPYFFDNKAELVFNCRAWLRPGGYLVTHIVDPAHSEFRFKSPRVNPNDADDADVDDSIGDFADRPQGVKQNDVDTLGFSYSAQFSAAPSPHTTAASGGVGDRSQQKHVTLTETFVDMSTKHVRQHQQTMVFEGEKRFVTLVKMTGFAVLAKIDLRPVGAPGEALYIFQKSI